MPEQTRVLYNAACPVCAAEINHYDRYTQANGLPIRFEDLGAEDLTAWGLTREDAAKRLHVLHEGQIHAGIPAFLVLWEQMPRYRWLRRIVGLPGIRHGAVFTYDRILAPALYAWHKRRQKRGLQKARD